jgi:transcriptional regulator with XRE-family HTH domain
VAKHKTLREWLDDRDQTQTWLADQLDISVGMVNDILQGRKSPGLQLAIKIEKLTGIPPRAFSEVA